MLTDFITVQPNTFITRVQGKYGPHMYNAFQQIFSYITRQTDKKPHRFCEKLYSESITSYSKSVSYIHTLLFRCWVHLREKFMIGTVSELFSCYQDFE